MPKLGVNIDHVATIRQARRGREPDPVWAAAEAELAGADGITLHLREDRRHIQDRDLRILKDTVQVKLNLEMAMNDEIIAIALDVHPDQVTLVPEKRQEVTTEGGLDVVGQEDRVTRTVEKFQTAGIIVSLFIDPEAAQIHAASRAGARAVELHTGRYAEARGEVARETAFAELATGAHTAIDLGLECHAGHGLNYVNVRQVAEIPGLSEMNIGHSIISRAVFVGLRQAVREMKDLITVERA
jgi:pyridoxine 5-phosphate synthase